MSTRRTLGGILALLTCPCHVVPLLAMAGGAAGTAWLFQHLGVILTALGAVFLGSLWLLLGPARDRASTAAAACASCATNATVPAGPPRGSASGPGNVLRRS